MKGEVIELVGGGHRGVKVEMDQQPVPSFPSLDAVLDAPAGQFDDQKNGLWIKVPPGVHTVLVRVP